MTVSPQSHVENLVDDSRRPNPSLWLTFTKYQFVTNFDNEFSSAVGCGLYFFASCMFVKRSSVSAPHYTKDNVDGMQKCSNKWCVFFIMILIGFQVNGS